MNDKRFIEEVYEIAWGCDAISKDYTHEDVISRLNQFNIESLRFAMLFDITFGQYNSIDDFEKAKKQFLEDEEYEV